MFNKDKIKMQLNNIKNKISSQLDEKVPVIKEFVQKNSKIIGNKIKETSKKIF